MWGWWGQGDELGGNGPPRVSIPVSPFLTHREKLPRRRTHFARVGAAGHNVLVRGDFGRDYKLGAFRPVHSRNCRYCRTQRTAPAIGRRTTRSTRPSGTTPSLNPTRCIFRNRIESCVPVWVWLRALSLNIVFPGVDEGVRVGPGIF